MATFKICVFRHQRRGIDGKYPVSIRVYWQKKSAYINTEYYVEPEQIAQNKKKGIFELRDTAIIAELTRRIKNYEKAKIDKLGINIYNYSASELARYFEDLTQSKGKDRGIDFIEFARGYEKKEKEKGRDTGRINTALNALADFCGGSLFISNLTSKFLKKFEGYLKTERKITRINQLGKPVTTVNKPVSDSTVADYMKEIRAIFNAALSEYNDEESGIIKIQHYPFKIYKAPKIQVTKKRNISGREIYKISRIPEKWFAGDRIKLSRDMFMLSFILVGMNLKDLYDLKSSAYKNGRIAYNRSKTKGKRKDKALISIKIEPEAKKYFKLYKDETKGRLFRFYRMYSNSHSFVSAVSKGLKKVAKITGADPNLSSYYARHSWATIARNKCKISKSDIDECLNHVSEETKMADVYIEKDWTLIDESNKMVLDYVFTACNPRKVFVKKATSKATKFVRKCRKNKSGSLSKAALSKPIV